MNTGVTLRYAGDDFLENIGQLSDLDPYYEDASSNSSPSGWAGRSQLQKLSFDQQTRSCTGGKAASATLLEHNDLIGIFLSNSVDPDYILRVVRPFGR